MAQPATRDGRLSYRLLFSEGGKRRIVQAKQGVLEFWLRPLASARRVGLSDRGKVRRIGC